MKKVKTKEILRYINKNNPYDFFVYDENLIIFKDDLCDYIFFRKENKIIKTRKEPRYSDNFSCFEYSQWKKIVEECKYFEVVSKDEFYKEKNKYQNKIGKVVCVGSGNNNQYLVKKMLKHINKRKVC